MEDLNKKLKKLSVKIDRKETLATQLMEVEILQSMFLVPEEFKLFDPNVIDDIKAFIEGIGDRPRLIDFTINFMVGDKQLLCSITLPINYPYEEPEVYIKSDCFSREQQRDLNCDLSKHMSGLERGDMRILPMVSWLQENTFQYFDEEKIVKPRGAICVIQIFIRQWLYSHHVYDKKKRESIIKIAKEYNVSGFCLPGKPGIICIEGVEPNVNKCYQEIRGLNWKKMVCKKIESIRVPKDASPDTMRKFCGFEELDFKYDNNKLSKKHMDLGMFYVYLMEHNCACTFKSLFGVEGKIPSTPN